MDAEEIARLCASLSLIDADVDGPIVQISSSSLRKDVTELKKAENLLETVMAENLQVVVGKQGKGAGIFSIKESLVKDKMVGTSGPGGENGGSEVEEIVGVEENFVGPSEGTTAMLDH
ncbi:hypothetical protein ACOSQ2_010658 [Xanthoceras sorbifolium]